MFCTTSETEGEVGAVKHIGSLLPIIGVRASVTFHLMCVDIIFSSVSVLSGHLLGNSYSFGRQYDLFLI